MEAREIVEVLTELEEKSNIEGCFMVMLDLSTDLIKHYEIQDVCMSMMCDEIHIMIEQMDDENFVAYDVVELKEKLFKFQMEYPMVPVVCSCSDIAATDDIEFGISSIACLVYNNADKCGVGIVAARDDDEMINILRLLNPVCDTECSSECNCTESSSCGCEVNNQEIV